MSDDRFDRHSMHVVNSNKPSKYRFKTSEQKQQWDKRFDSLKKILPEYSTVEDKEKIRLENQKNKLKTR